MSPIANPNVLVLGLQNKDLVFPGGKPWCLRCGAEATGAARVFFQSDPGFHLTSAGRMLGQFQAIAGQVTFRAQLCPRHLLWIWKARLVCLLLAAFAIGMIGAGAAASGPQRGGTPALIGVGAAVVSFLMMIPVWRRKDRGGLPCNVAKSGDGRLVLSYPGPAPKPSWTVEEDPPPPEDPKSGLPRPVRRR